MVLSLIQRFTQRTQHHFISDAKATVARINSIEQCYQTQAPEELLIRTAVFRQRLANATDKAAVLREILPEAFASVKNAARRLQGHKYTVCGKETVWDMVPFDAQLIGAIALHEGKVAEMATGEGKTLSAAIALYLNSLAGRNVRLATANDFLARRDAEWMRPLYQMLGLTVGHLAQEMTPEQRLAMYRCHVTYGTASEFGFDYLRDNTTATSPERQVQRDSWYCIVDEADSLLIDEARLPLLISGLAPEKEEPYSNLKDRVAPLVPAQARICEDFLREAEAILRNQDSDRDELSTAACRLLQVKMGSPKHPELRRILEHKEWRELFDSTEVFLRSRRKEVIYTLKEELLYVVDETQGTVDLTELGRRALQPDNPGAFVLPDIISEFQDLDRDTALTPIQREERKEAIRKRHEAVAEGIHATTQLLRAYALYQKDVDYVVIGGQVAIVDQTTGRVQVGRRWGDGLHQAVEAKEGVKVERETRTLALITLQNYFRQYEKLAGMTGTASTEAQELREVYGLEVRTIPPHQPCIREDHDDVVFLSKKAKFAAVAEEIAAAHRRGQPVLVGTASVEASEALSCLLQQASVPHVVLNAKLHQQEAEIIARAGQRGAVTITTSMAGRGTDIRLGEGVRELGGLYVIGTERHGCRRVDRQLRGRCGRQGDPGTTRFFLSLEDELMRMFIRGNLITAFMGSALQADRPLVHPWLSRSIEGAQKKVEGQGYTARRQLVEYDNVLNQQREAVYGLRNAALQAARPRDLIFEQVRNEIDERLAAAGCDHAVSTEALEELGGWLRLHFPLELPWRDLAGQDPILVSERLVEHLRQSYAAKEALEPASIGLVERHIMTSAIDQNWRDHLTRMEELRQSCGLRVFGQRDPLMEYKREAYTAFEALMGRIRSQICSGVFRSASSVELLTQSLALLKRAA